MSDLEAGMSYVEKLDFRDQQHRFEMEERKLAETEATKRAKYELREARQETYQIVGIALCVAAVILGIAFFIWRGNMGPDYHGQSPEERREATCMDHGGTWIPGSIINAQSSDTLGMCVMPGVAPKNQASQ